MKTPNEKPTGEQSQQPEWRPVVGWDGLYEVSDDGQVRGTRRRGSTGRPLSQYTTRDGHRSVNLSRAPVRSTAKVHRLVLEAFVGQCPPGEECRHLNDIGTDNRLENLVWGTRSENKLDMVRLGTHHESRKTHCKTGHRYDAKNTRWYRRARVCRKCELARTQKRRAAA